MNEPNIKRFWENLNNAKLIRYLLLFALAWAIIQVLAYFGTVLIVFIFAGVLAFLLSYPVKWVEHFLPHTVAATIVFLFSLLLVGGLIATLGFTILSQAQQLFAQAPQFIESVISLIDRIQNVLTNLNFQVDFQGIEEQVRNQALVFLGNGFTTIQALLSNFIDLVLILVVAFFMLLDGKQAWNFILKIFPESFRYKFNQAIKKNLLGFFWGRLVLSLFFGISVFFVFITLKLPYGLVLATIAGIFDLIPGIGATIGISLVCLIILPQGIWQAVKVLASCVILQQVEENLLMPRIMQGSINMNPVFMFFALLVGAEIAGLVGVFLSIPIAGVLTSLFEIEEVQGKH